MAIDIQNKTPRDQRCRRGGEFGCIYANMRSPLSVYGAQVREAIASRADRNGTAQGAAIESAVVP
ncbi:hypothetical protein H6F75_27145 [Nodosilinea sp. FACHB-131]|uniref:hypothetical protein n=1 Tax=Cyanophyceae TaxID=3028117 RepID=UPI001682BF6D|nr:hypothetical protein [Nodosilinea sp. FACHB-131]MBD1877164.1 hypothetical protein [Nodosilinea sp. FACHB-131]